MHRLGFLGQSYRDNGGIGFDRSTRDDFGHNEHSSYVFIKYQIHMFQLFVIKKDPIHHLQHQIQTDR